ncbi:MAG: cytidylate kinase-like family protein, partial [Muribaculaceae bacterium]|nr:cytidylate kinase-like family protein [Muribaculaceae bacterium]
VGRTADYVLSAMPGVVSVSLCASLSDRADRIMRRSDITNKPKAVRMAEKIDKLRASYYNFYTDKRWGDPTSYDITFNSSAMSIERISDVLIEYIRHRHA